MLTKGLSHKIYYTTFLLALFVVLLHASYLEVLDPTLPGYEPSYVIQRVFCVIGDAAVPTFFVVSGYLLFAKFTLRGYPKMLLGKVFSLVIPYFIWSIVAFLFMQLIYPLWKGEPIAVTFQSTVVGILLANDYPHLWFIRPLLVFFIGSPLLYFVFKYLKKWSIFIPVVLFIIYLFFRPEYGGIVLWIPFFFVGGYLSYFQIPILNPYRPRLVGAIALTILLGVALTFSLLHTQYEDHAYYVYRFFSPAFIWLAMDVLTSLYEKQTIRGIFQTSGFIYFSHLFIVNAFKELFQLGIPADTNLRCLLLFFLSFFAGTAVTLGLTYLLKRFAQPVYRYLGGRS